MDEQSRGLLLEIEKLTQENNTMLKKMRRAQKNSRAFKAFYWIVIIILTYVGYMYAKPYLEQMKEIYTAAQTQLQNFKDMSNSVPVKK